MSLPSSHSESAAARIVVVGSSNTDMVVQLDRLPLPGETRLGGAFASHAGGKGANQAVAAARAGGAVTFVARVGQDALGEAALEGFLREGIDTAHVGLDTKTPSGVALIFVGANGENSIAVASGANDRLSPADIAQAAEAIAGARVLLVQLETPLPAVKAAIEQAAEAGVRVILNPAPAPQEPLPAALLAKVDVLTPNETEAELLTGLPVKTEAEARLAAARLLEMGVKNVLITLGKRGALWARRAAGSHGFTGETPALRNTGVSPVPPTTASNIEMELVPGFAVDPVDTTAAGDTFNGALAVALAASRHGQPDLDAIRFAHAAAALSVTRAGAQTSAPFAPEIAAFLAGNAKG